MCVLSHVQLFETPWTVACQASLSMEFSKQEYWSRLSYPVPGDLPDPRIEPMSPTLAGGFFTTEPPGKPLFSLFKKTVYYNVLTAFMSIYESDFLLSDTAIMLSS